MADMYVLQCKPGMDADFAAALARIALVPIMPQRVAMNRCGGSWSEAVYYIFRGYIFLEADWSAETYQRIKSCTGFLKVLGGAEAPASLAEHERQWVLKLWNGGKPLPVSTVYVNGEGTVMGISGMLAEFDRISRINLHSRRAYVNVTICGKPHNITLAFTVKGNTEAPSN